MHTCPTCGTPGEGIAFCGTCGTKMSSQRSEPETGPVILPFQQPTTSFHSYSHSTLSSAGGTPPASSTKKFVVIGAVVALVAAAGVGAWLIFGGSAAPIPSSSVAEDFEAPPAVGTTIRVRDLLDKRDAYFVPTVLRVTDELLVVQAGGSSDFERESTLSGVSRATGEVVWHLESSEISAEGAGVDCKSQPTQDTVVCLSTDYSDSGKSNVTMITTVNATSGEFQQVEVDGETPYYGSPFIGDVPLISSSLGDGEFEISLVDVVTGEPKWTAAVVVEGSEFAAPTLQGGFVWVLESELRASGSADFTTVLIDPATGERAHELEGIWVAYGAGWFGYADQEDREGAARINLDGSMMWENDKVNLLSSPDDSTSAILLAHDDETLVALDPENGEVIWESPAKFDEIGVSYQGAGYAFVGDSDSMRLIELATGTQLVKSTGAFVGESDSLIYAVKNEALTAYSKDGAKKVWSAKFDDLDSKVDEQSASIILQDGVLMLVDLDEIRILQSAE